MNEDTTRQEIDIALCCILGLDPKHIVKIRDMHQGASGRKDRSTGTKQAASHSGIWNAGAKKHLICFADSVFRGYEFRSLLS